MATISENLQTLVQTKEDIKTALTNKGVSVSDKLIDVPDEIASISGGSSPVLDSITITSNGTYTPPAGTDGYNNITVNVPSDTPEMIRVKVCFPDYDTPGRYWKSSAFQIRYFDSSTGGQSVISRSGSGTGEDAIYNYYEVPVGTLVLPNWTNTQNTGTCYFSDDGGANWTATSDYNYYVYKTAEYTPYGGTQTSVILQQAYGATADRVCPFLVSLTTSPK